MAKKHIKTTKLDIIKCASAYFFEIGYSATSPRIICDELDLSTGNLTYYFPTKEHLLAVFVEMLCNFQWDMIEKESQDENMKSILAVCHEFATMAAMCEQDEIAKDFLTAIYTSPMCLDIIRKNDAERAKNIFSIFHPDWLDEQYVEAEILVSGIEYATVMRPADTSTLEMHIEGGLNNILTTFGVPEKIRKQKIEKTLSMNYRKTATKVLKEFKKFINQANEKAFEELGESKRVKN